MIILQENIPLEEVFENLRCNHGGLTFEQAQQRLQIFGPNKLEEEEVRVFWPLWSSLGKYFVLPDYQSEQLFTSLCYFKFLIQLDC
jgi:hypothetical protein